MKKLLWVIFVFAFANQLQAQIQSHKADLYLKAIDLNEAPVPFIKLVLKTEEDTNPQYNITHTNGNAKFSVITGNSYKVYLDDSLFLATINIPIRSMSYITQKVTLPELSPKIIANKNSIDTIDQTQIALQRPDPGSIFFKVGLRDHLNQAVKNMEIRIFNPELKMVYKAKTNSSGVAQFHVPGKSKYIVGVDKFESFDTVAVPHHSFGLGLTYIPTKIRENENNDTITQSGSQNMRTTSDRALLKIYLKDHDNQALPNEEIWLNQMGSTKVYYGKTGRDGILTMLLPKGNQYELNFKYERAMKRLDYPLDPTLFTTKIFMTYIGSKKVEEFYANANRKGGYRTEFMEPKTSPITMEPNVLEITQQGFNLNFPDEGIILTPAVHNNKLFVSSGYYSPNIYCVEATTGQSQWGVKLAESGPSVLVIEDGMLLINTQSCTLYAIDIETGMLAWSKWLGPNIYHSPTIMDGKVYAAYPDDLTYSSDKFILAAFDLKTGEIVWQSRLKNEPLSAPVADGDKVFITDVYGVLYSFDIEKGEQLAMVSAHATCTPVFDGKVLWVNTQINKDSPICNLTVFNPNTLAKIKSFEIYGDTISYSSLFLLGASERMSYTRNRLLIRKDCYYQINKNGLQSFSSSGECKWTTSIQVGSKNNAILTFAGENILASTKSNELVLIDPLKGEKIKKYNVSEILSSEPAIANGWIYCGTKNGKLLAINTKDKNISGWNQWGMNANHNPVIK